MRRFRTVTQQPPCGTLPTRLLRILMEFPTEAPRVPLATIVA